MMTLVYITSNSLHLRSDASRGVLEEAGLTIAKSPQEADWVVAYKQKEIPTYIGTVPNILLHTDEPFFADLLPFQSTYRGTEIHSFSPWTTGLEDGWKHFVHSGRFDFLDPADTNRNGMVILASTKRHAHGKFAEDLTAVRYRIAVRAHERDMIDIYGRGWGDIPVVAESRYPQGATFSEIKHGILAGYQINLCLENSHARGYVTEKLWQAIRGGCLPVYYGSSWLDSIFSSADYVDLRNYGSVDELLDYIESLDSDEVIGRVTRMQAQLEELESGLDLDLQRIQQNWAANVAAHITAIEDRRRRQATTWRVADETAAQLANRTGVASVVQREANKGRASAYRRIRRLGGRLKSRLTQILPIGS